MYNIYIKTPLVNNSIHIPHLVEHSLFWKVNDIKDFFSLEEKSMSTYPYYTLIKLFEDWDENLKRFLIKIKEKLSKENIIFEKKIIAEENTDISYYQLLIEKIWKKLYWEQFNYNKTNKVKYIDVINYHQNFYTDENIFIVEKNKNFKNIDLNSEENKKFKLKNSFEIKIRWEKENVFIFENNLLNWFLITLFDNLIDNYLTFNLYHKKWKYYYWESDFWFFNDFVYISIWKEFKYLKWIDKIFIKNYIEYKLRKFKKDIFIDFDWVSLVKFGYTLSDNSKKEIIKNLDYYFWKFLKSIYNRI